MPRSTSQNFCCQCPCPCSEPQPLPASAGDSPTLAGRSSSVSCGVTAPSPWVLMHTLLCVCPPRVESLFPPVLSKSCNQIPLAFKVWFSGNSSSCCRNSRLGDLTWGSEPSLQWVDFCGIIVLQFVSHPPSGHEIWFYCDCTPPTISLWILLCLWMWGIFLVSSSVFLSMIVQQAVVILVLLQEGMSARPSTLPMCTKLSHLYFFKLFSKSAAPTFLASGTGFVEDNFSTGEGRDGWGSNASNGEWQMKLCLLAHGSPPAVWASS